MQRSCYDLNALLNQVLQENYTDKRYYTPSISWSEEYMLSRYGEYQYCDNHITISRLMNTVKVSEKAIMSVIYHELLHQHSAEHTKAFEKKLLLFPDYEKLQKELDSYFGEIEDIPTLDAPRAIDTPMDKTVFLLLPNKYDEQYLQQFIYYDRGVYLETNRKRSLPDISNALIIWIAQNDIDTFVVGWSCNSKIYSDKQKTSHKKLGGLDFSFQVKGKGENTHIILPCNCTCVIQNELFPPKLSSKGYCLATEIKDFEVADVLSYISHYSMDFHVIGLLDRAINCCAPLTEKDITKLLALSKKSVSAYRAVWIANLAVQLNRTYETLFNRADVLRYAGVLDEALETFSEAIDLSPDMLDAKLESLKLCVMLNNKNMALELFKNMPEGFVQTRCEQSVLQDILKFLT
jgi:tetratricopeptide (TPR) repeat protein